MNLRSYVLMFMLWVWSYQFNESYELQLHSDDERLVEVDFGPDTLRVVLHQVIIEGAARGGPGQA